MSAVLPTTPQRTAAQKRHGQRPVTVLELDVDRCNLTYGVSPCAATGAVGSECYNCFHTCQDLANFDKGVQTLKFIDRGSDIPVGETLRPYLLRESDNAPTVIDIEAGLSRRATLTIHLADEPDNDAQTDPYRATRATPAGGTFWTRLIARNPNLVGRTARVRRGFAPTSGAAWDWATFLDERYIIANLSGPDGSGRVSLTLKDPLKALDNVMIPAATDGKLVAELKATAYSGLVDSATLTSVTFSSKASAIDGALDGMEVFIVSNTGSGQRRIISGYVGATRTGQVPAWAVLPNNLSVCEVSALSINVGVGKGEQYDDPATSGKREFVRIGKEDIEYTVKVGDVLSWPDASHREQFGTARSDHKVGDAVQLCRAWINKKPYTGVVKDILNTAGIVDGMIDIAQLTTEESTWLGSANNITAILGKPEKASTLIAELMRDTNGVQWWSPATQEVETLVVMPRFETPALWSDESTFKDGSVEVEPLDDLRLTEAVIWFDLKDANASNKDATNYQTAERVIDPVAIKKYEDSRPQINYSRWFTAANQDAMRARMIRRQASRADAPKRMMFRITQKDYTVPVGQLVDVLTRKLVDFSGQKKRVRVLITKMNDRGDYIEGEGRITDFGNRNAFIAPAGTADYPADTAYEHVAYPDGTMGDGTPGYGII